uniref:Uncharacterized protein n=1 Tax=Nothobranchius furzeri TaxID=105023 RepID=A0A8C6M786_NOTFU
MTSPVLPEQNIVLRISEGYKNISKALHISQNTVAKVIQKFKKDGKNHHASSLQLAKAVESQAGVTVSHDTIWRTPQRNGMHGNHP